MLKPPRVRAPQLPQDRASWLNLGNEESLPTVGKGRVTLLDFWTAGCVNCRHVLPDLAYLEARFGGSGLQIIGIHSPKFDAEHGETAVREAVARLGIIHPVVRDDDHALRRAFTVRAWPTFLVIDANGYIVLQVSGEGNRALLAETIGSLLGEPATDSATSAALPFVSDTLRFPGKVLTDAALSCLFIADTGNHRIVVLPLETTGAEPVVIGAGSAGFVDGDFAEARFHSPQGMVLSADRATLYVADADNHAIRAVRFGSRTVHTVAGTGQQQTGPLREGAARTTRLNSPWDVALSTNEQSLFVAMAGAHQIACLDLPSGLLRVLAGSGREGRQDGMAREAAFAQPSGIVRAGETLYVVDAESSSVRVVDGGQSPMVTTLAGGDLFDWGDRDGDSHTARFQHPEGIALIEGTLFVADTYNGRVCATDPRTGDVRTIARGLFSPTGIAAAPEGKLFVVESGRHRVVLINPQHSAVCSITGECFPS